MTATIRTGLDNELLPLGRLLDEAPEMISFGDVVAGMNNLFRDLWQSRIGFSGGHLSVAGEGSHGSK